MENKKKRKMEFALCCFQFIYFYPMLIKLFLLFIFIINFVLINLKKKKYATCKLRIVAACKEGLGSSFSCNFGKDGWEFRVEVLYKQKRRSAAFGGSVEERQKKNQKRE